MYSEGKKKRQEIAVKCLDKLYPRELRGTVWHKNHVELIGCDLVV